MRLDMKRTIIGLALGLGASLTAMANPYQVPAQDFLGADWMQSPIHRVAPMAQNNGAANIYIIETPDRAYTVHGTDQARTLIREIHAVHMLRQRSTTGAVVKSIKNRTANMVTTPLRTVKSIGGRLDRVESFEDAAFFIPQTIGEVGGTLINGAGEMAVTGARIAKGATGTRCDNFGNCAANAGKDMWSGVNSLTGKHNVSRRLHASLGTSPETQNKALKREIDRLSYAEAYSGTAFKFSVPNMGLNYVSDYQRGIGYYNNSEFVAGYEDAHRSRNHDKASLKVMGVPAQTIDALYANQAFTKTDRAALISAINGIGRSAYTADFAQDAAAASAPHIAKTKVEIYKYFAHLAQTGQIADFISGPSTMIRLRNGALILPLKADYLQWTPETAQMTRYLSRSARQQKNRAELHILGGASPEFKNNAGRMGVRVVEIR